MASKYSSFCVLLLVLPLALPAAAQRIDTVVGNGDPAFGGDGGPAIDASLHYPTGAILDAAGNLYIADQANQRVRKVDANTAIITTVAGNGDTGFSGDGGAAVEASLNFPLGLALDAAGNLFIADQTNSRIRMVDTSGVITTVAGNGNPEFSGDGGPAVAAGLQYASGVFVDSNGDLLIADRNNQRIRKVDAATGIITTIAGNGVAGFGGDGGPATGASFFSPVDVAEDAEGNLYIVDQLNERIRKVDTSGIITTVAGTDTPGFSGDGGPATSAELNNPLDVTVDPWGNLLIADLDNHRIRKVSNTSGIITTFAGNGTADFSGDGGPATSASLNRPRAVAEDEEGNLFVADLYNHRIRRVGLSAKDLIEELIEDVQELGLPGMAGQAQLNAALNALDQDPPNVQAAINDLLSFINFVNAQAGKKIPVEDAEQLINDAQAIIDLLTG